MCMCMPYAHLDHSHRIGGRGGKTLVEGAGGGAKKEAGLILGWRGLCHVGEHHWFGAIVFSVVCPVFLRETNYQALWPVTLGNVQRISTLMFYSQ